MSLWTTTVCAQGGGSSSTTIPDQDAIDSGADRIVIRQGHTRNGSSLSDHSSFGVTRKRGRCRRTSRPVIDALLFLNAVGSKAASRITPRLQASFQGPVNVSTPMGYTRPGIRISSRSLIVCWIPATAMPARLAASSSTACTIARLPDQSESMVPCNAWRSMHVSFRALLPHTA